MAGAGAKGPSPSPHGHLDGETAAPGRTETEHIAPLPNEGWTWLQNASQLRSWESGIPGTPSLRLRTPDPISSSLRPRGSSPLLPQGPFLFCPECVLLKEGAVSPTDTLLHCGDMLGAFHGAPMQSPLSSETSGDPHGPWHRDGDLAPYLSHCPGLRAALREPLILSRPKSPHAQCSRAHTHAPADIHTSHVLP